MGIAISIFSILCCAAANFWFGYCTGKLKILKRIHAVSDNFEPRKGRTEAQIKNDMVLQLSNEIAKLDAIRTLDIGKGRKRLCMWIYKEKG
jgi:hypothetical protein